MGDLKRKRRQDEVKTGASAMLTPVNQHCPEAFTEVFAECRFVRHL
jgi:hypothetical protein